VATIEARMDRVQPRVKEERKQVTYQNREGLILAGIVFCVSIFCGYELLFRYHVIYGDALSRVLTGLYMIWGGHFHLAAMSFYWSPLISLCRCRLP